MKTVKLGDVCEKIGSGATPRGGSEVYQSAGVSLIRSQNIYNEGFKKDGLAYISNHHAYELENVTVKSDDILLNITGDSVARTCQVPEEILPARVNQHVAIIRPRKDILDARYLRYFLSPLRCSSICLCSLRQAQQGKPLLRV
jgi:type I restriction enzyme S subunit